MATGGINGLISTVQDDVEFFKKWATKKCTSEEISSRRIYSIGIRSITLLGMIVVSPYVLYQTGRFIVQVHSAALLLGLAHDLFVMSKNAEVERLPDYDKILGLFRSFRSHTSEQAEKLADQTFFPSFWKWLYIDPNATPVSDLPYY